MSAFDLFEQEAAGKLEQAALNPLDTSQSPGFFDGALTGAGTGLVRLGADVQRVTGLAAGAIAGSLDQIAGTRLQDAVFRNVVAPADKLARRMTPDPMEVGMAGQILHGFVKIGGEAALLGPGGTLGLEMIGGTLDQMDKGVDLQTAAKVGLVQGTATAAGVALPMTLGARTTVLQNVLYGGATNVAQGVFQRGATGEILAAAGYRDMAEQYRALDAQAVAVDAVLGAAFSGLGRAMQKTAGRPFLTEPKPSDIDAALVANQALHAETIGPGIPADLASREAHVANLYGAIDDLIEGRPVTMRQPVGEMVAHPVKEANNAAAAAELQALARAEADAAGVDLLRPEPEPLPPETVAPKAAAEPEAGRPDASPGERTSADIPEVQAARQIAQAMPDARILLEDGQTATMADAVALMDDIATAGTTLRRGIEAAVACFLRSA